MIKLTKLNIASALAVIIMAIFGVVKSMVLLEIVPSTGSTRWVEASCFLAFVPLALYVYRQLIDRKETKILELEKFLEESAIISKADANGKITYVNHKFEEISGWKLSEVIGKDHNIVNSGYHPREFWTDMYKTTIKERKIWNGIVTNRAKNGKLYYVDTFIKAMFNVDGEHIGFLSIRQDVTAIAESNAKLNSLVASQTSYVLRTDMQGRHTYWNQKFEDEFGWVYEGNMMHGNSLLSICESHHGAAHDAVMECIAEPGKIVKVELDKPHRDGSRKTTFWEFVCLTDVTGTPTEVQCMGIDITERIKAEREIEKKNTYLEHAAKILRHDMHSGINTYIPRGLSSLERRLNAETIKDLKIEAPLKMIKEGLKHTQKVYSGVYEFTNLVKKDVVLNKSIVNLKSALEEYLTSTAYKPQVIIDDLGEGEVNEALFCTSIDNLIRNGLKYNDSLKKEVKIYREGNLLFVEDNGRGLSQEEFEHLSKPYTRKEGQKESGTGLGLNICIAILEEHGFSISCEKLPTIGTKLTIKLK